jgi:hypothetical protein
MKHRVGVVVLAASTSIACADDTLSPARAATLIGGLDGFKREAHIRIRTGAPLQSAFGCLSQAQVERAPLNQFMVNRGWLRYEMHDAIVGFGTKASCRAMALTPSGEAAAAEWTESADMTGGTMWVIPIGRRELVAVAAIATAPDESSRVEYDWKWTPNETGAALRKVVSKANAFFDLPRRSRALCRRLNDRWRCQLGMSPADALGELSP